MSRVLQWLLLLCASSVLFLPSVSRVGWPGSKCLCSGDTTECSTECLHCHPEADAPELDNQTSATIAVLGRSCCAQPKGPSSARSLAASVALETCSPRSANSSCCAEDGVQVGGSTKQHRQGSDESQQQPRWRSVCSCGQTPADLVIAGFVGLSLQLSNAPWVWEPGRLAGMVAEHTPRSAHPSPEPPPPRGFPA